MAQKKTCPNCKAQYTCSCKKRIATDGTICCAKCVSTTNAALARAARNKVL